MNDLIYALNLEGFKPFVSMLLLPPVPLLLLVLGGAWLLPRRRGWGWGLVLAAVVGLWLSATPAASKGLRLLQPIPPPLDAGAVAELKRTAARVPTAIVVLGGGRKERAAEYGMADLSSLSLERLRYGVWLSRETGLPLAYTGGLGHAHAGSTGATEAEIAARITEREWGRPLRWQEARSRDTAENGRLTVPLLHEAGIRRLVVVTSDFHQPRALRAFRRGAELRGLAMELVPAPVGWHSVADLGLDDFVPGARGFAETRWVLHEILGYWLGA